MKLTFKYGSICFLLGSLAGGLAASAQEVGPPKVLFIAKEITKPGKGGAMHEKTEAAFVTAMTAAKAPGYYFAEESITGPDRALFLTPYDSFEEMAATHKAIAKIPGLNASLDRRSC
jgi:hypothetical protein